MLDGIVTFRAGKTVEDIATSVDFRDAHLLRELLAPLFVEPYIVEELPKQSLTFGDNAVVSEQIFRIIRGEDLRRCSETKIQTIPSPASSETILHKRLLHHTALASLFATFGRVIYRSKLPSPSVLTPCDYRTLQSPAQ